MSNKFTKITKISEQNSYPDYDLTEIKQNWFNKNWKGWHSPDWEERGRPTRDDEYLRAAIISKFPITRTSLSIDEIDANWKNVNWWQENLGNVIYIIDNMYVKESVKAYNGIYSNWLTRLVQFINTLRAERKIKNEFGFIWNETDHVNIHTGIATGEENKPDFISRGRETVELKVCENEDSIKNYYFKKLTEDYDHAKAYDFHDAEYAMFATKSPLSNIYTVKLDKNVTYTLDDVQTLSLGLLPTEHGKLKDWHDNPALPYCLMYGLTPKWQQKK